MDGRVMCSLCGEWVHPIYGGDCPNCGEEIPDLEDEDYEEDEEYDEEEETDSDEYSDDEDDNINSYLFESSFIDAGDTILSIVCYSISGINTYHVIINTFEDPRTLYFREGESIPDYDDYEYFRDELFHYLKEKHPGYFG